MRKEQVLGWFNAMSVSGIRKLAGQVFVFGIAFFARLVLGGGSLQAQTPLQEFETFLTNPPPIEGIVFERKLLMALPTPPGVTNKVPTGPFFQLRLQTNAYFLRQMDVIGEAPQNHRAGNLLEGEWDEAYWNLGNGQLNLWPDRKAARLKKEAERSKISDPILRLGMDERINLSSIVWKGDTFTARGTDGSRFEGRIESRTVAGLPERIVAWSDHDPGLHFGVDYKYRLSFHPWLPVSIKPFLKRGKLENRHQEFYVRSFKMGLVTSPENFLPTLFTNANTFTILHTKAGLESFYRNRKLSLAAMSPQPRTNNVPPSSSALPTNALLPATPSSNKAPSPPPSSMWLIVALVCLSIPPLMLIVFTIRANKRDVR